MVKKYFLAIILVLLVALPFVYSSKDSDEKFTPKAKKDRDEGGDHTYLVELDEGSARGHKGFADDTGCKEKYLSSSSSFAVLNCDSPAINHVAGKSHVHRIYNNEILHPLLADTVAQVKAPDAWNNFSVNGSGMIIAIVDSGLNKSLDMFNGVVLAEIDFTPEGTVLDIANHGTSVAAVAISQNESNGKGVAYGAKILNAKACYNVFGQAGCASADILAAIDWSVTQGAHVISLSIGSATDSCANSGIAVDINQTIVNSNIPVVIGAGNGGPGNESIYSPACGENSIAVGGNEGNSIATQSSRGPVQGANIKPDVVAPFTSSVPDVTGFWVTRSGTSISTPHVAGIVALMIQARPELNRTNNNHGWRDIKAILRQTATDLGYEFNVQGKGRVNALDAVNESIKRDLRDPFLNWTLSATYPTPAPINQQFSVNLTALNSGNKNETNISITIYGYSGSLNLVTHSPTQTFASALANTSVKPGWVLKSNKAGSWILQMNLTSPQKNATISFNQTVG